MKNDCIFCKIINGDIPVHKIYEDKHTLAFLDVANDVDGHTLIIPKTHHENVLDIKEEDYLHTLKTVKKLANHFVDNCGYGGVNILNNSGIDAGQSVLHLHFHLFPRKENDNAQLWPSNDVATQSLQEMQKKLQLK